MMMMKMMMMMMMMIMIMIMMFCREEGEFAEEIENAIQNKATSAVHQVRNFIY